MGKRKRTVVKGTDEYGDITPGLKTVTIIKGDKKILKQKLTDSDGTKRKLKTKYKGYRQKWTLKPDKEVSKTFTIKGGGSKRRKENLMK